MIKIHHLLLHSTCIAGGRPLWMWWWTFAFHKMWWISSNWGPVSFSRRTLLHGVSYMMLQHEVTEFPHFKATVPLSSESRSQQTLTMMAACSFEMWGSNYPTNKQHMLTCSCKWSPHSWDLQFSTHTGRTGTLNPLKFMSFNMWHCTRYKSFCWI